MVSVSEVFKKCFSSDGSLYREFLLEGGVNNILYYPSTGGDLRPFVFSKKENLEFVGLREGLEEYKEPDLFVFSDYFPYSDSKFFDSKVLHMDQYTSIVIQDYCELGPNPENYTYLFNKQYVHSGAGSATGRAVLFRADIESQRAGRRLRYVKYGIYFFYENINLIEQLFLRHHLPVSHLVWKRDGSGFGGGSVRHNFLLPVGHKLGCQWFFVWDHYLDDNIAKLDARSTQRQLFPKEIGAHFNDEFEMSVEKKIKMKWGLDDVVNLYVRSPGG